VFGSPLPAVEQQLPFHDRAVRDDTAVVAHHGVQAAERVRPVVVVEVARKGHVYEPPDLPEVGRLESGGGPQDDGHH
jgi:hypothetical protein